ncbi:DUF1456 family protein [Saccharospirillum alexandrii]|uniref:DUF1456 family protein n=1 Tax=Saccharospirillum alexandrii TaxID=2448477 RepID=UPI003737063B
MTNNDILRRVRYTFDLKDGTMVDIFALADYVVTAEQVVGWLSKEEDSEFLKMTDRELAVFLNGFINFKRGKRDGQQPEPESRLNNNKVFQKLRIALNLKAEDILGILKLVDLDLSQHELSAFFRNPESSNYRECKDQVLRNFLLGVQLQLRPGDAGSEPIAG